MKDMRTVLQALVDKLDVVIPVVDGYIQLSHIRSGGQYTGPNLIKELKDAKDVLSAASDDLTEVDHFWTALANGWDIEPRAYFEEAAKTNGFKSPVEMAVHYMWKRHAKDWPNAKLKTRQQVLMQFETWLRLFHCTEPTGQLMRDVLAVLRSEINGDGDQSSTQA
jgi:hypothetical protein